MSDHVTRRDVVVAGLASVASPPFAGTALAQAPRTRSNAIRTRYSATSPKGKENLAKYAKAVKLLQALPARDPRSWQFWWNTHWIAGGPDPKTSSWISVVNFKGQALV